MINAINPVRSSPVQNLASAVSAAAPAAAKTVNALDVIGSVMKSRMQDGFDRPANAVTPATAATPAKKKKKKKGGLFGKIGGFLKKALGVVGKLGNLIPGLGAITKPLEIATSILGK